MPYSPNPGAPFTNSSSLTRGTAGVFNRINNELVRRPGLLILLAIICMAAILRIFQLSAESLWLDEATTYFVSKKSILEIFESTTDDVHPPLYYLVTHFFLFAGNSELILRLPSMLMGVFSVPLIYALAKRLFGEKEGLISAFLLSISIMHIFYSQEARMYSMLLFLSLCSMWSFLLALERNKKSYWMGFTLFTILSIYTHYFGVFIFLAQVLFYLFTGLSLSKREKTFNFFKLKNKAQFKSALASLLFVALAFSPRIHIALDQAGRRVGGDVTWGVSQFHYFNSIFSIFTTDSNSPSAYYLSIFFLGIIAVLARHIKQGLLLGIWLFVPILCTFFLASMMPFHPRYLIISLPAFLMLVARGATAIPALLLIKFNRLEKHTNGVLVVIALSFALATSESLTGYYSTIQKNDWREVARVLNAVIRNGDIVVPLPSYISKPLAYYYEDSGDATIRAVGYTGLELDSLVEQAGSNSLYFILTSDITAADPKNVTLSWLRENAKVLTIIGGVYILAIHRRAPSFE